MKEALQSFLKWFLLAFLLLSAFIAAAIFNDGLDSVDAPRALIIVTIGALFLAGFYVFLEKIIVPIRKRFMLRKVLRVFGAQPLTSNQALYTVGGFQFFIKIQLNLRMSQHVGGMEVIEFHLPREQFDWMPVKPKVKLKPDFFDNIPTYCIHACNPYGLRKAKKRIDRMVVVGDFF